jgi:hypothetical protein
MVPAERHRRRHDRHEGSEGPKVDFYRRFGFHVVDRGVGAVPGRPPVIAMDRPRP